MFKLKFKQKMKPNFLLCLTLRRKNPLKNILHELKTIAQINKIKKYKIILNPNIDSIP